METLIYIQIEMYLDSTPFKYLGKVEKKNIGSTTPFS